MNIKRDVDLSKIASQMKDCSGAETKAVCTEAGMYALRERRSFITQEDFELALIKIMKKDLEGNAAIQKLWN